MKITATLLTPRDNEYKAKLTDEVAERVLPLMADGRIVPLVDKVFPLEEAQQAQEYMEDNKNIGKIILKVK